MGKNLELSIKNDGIAELILNQENQKVNLLNTQVMKELDEILEGINSLKNIRVLIIKSGKKDNFIAGADVNEIAVIESKIDAERKSELGQKIFNKLENFHFPTVCVIEGACLGGGLELALSCKYRIATDNKKLKIGMPEVNLGIIPGFGGTKRLPKLAGLINGLDLILTGRTINGLKALKLKIVDAVYSQEFIKEKTWEFINKILNKDAKLKILKRRKRKFTERLLEIIPFTRALIFYRTKKFVMKKTRGFYPSALKALEVIKKTYFKSLNKSLVIERKVFAGLAVSYASKNLIKIFFINEKLKKDYIPDIRILNKIENKPVRQAAVIGAGRMGGGIAWLFSNAGIDIRMKDISWDALGKGMQYINEIYSELIKIRKIDFREKSLKMHKISASVDNRGLEKADFIIEAIVEDKNIKVKTLNELEKIIKDDAVIATNTSSIPVLELSKTLKHPERLIGFHFFNPVNRMPLVEVVKTDITNEETIYKAINLCRILNRMPILVNDCSGFLVNRILLSYLDEALVMLEEGIDLDIIDRAIYGFGMPMGPFLLLDVVGIKVGFKIAEILSKNYTGKINTGKLYRMIYEKEDINGISNGRGFYVYKGNKKIVNPDITAILKKLNVKKKKAKTEEIIDRALLRMINEASFCLSEGIIDNSGYLDMAMILGTGFPVFSGGLLSYADDVGLDKLLESFDYYKNKFGDRFAPCSLLIEMQKKKGRFYK